jgi:hypothetical protein
LSDRNPNQDPDKGFPRDVPLIHGPITPAEKEVQEERERRKASDKSEQDFKDRQITATEAANRLSSRSITISGITAFIAVLACIGTWYQGSENRKSWKTAQQTLDQMKADAAESAKQFQVQLGHFDDGLGRTGLLAAHAGEQAIAANESSRLASQQLALSKRQFETSQRAWVVIESVDTLNYLWLPQTGDLVIAAQLNYKNIGNLPATDIYIAQEGFAPGEITADFLEKIKDRQKSVCLKSIQETSTTKSLTAQAAIPTYPKQLSFTAQFGRVGGIHGQLMPFIVGCIHYRISNSNEVHQTGFILVAEKAHRAKTESPTLVFGDTYTSQDIELSRGYDGSAYSN